MLVRLTYRSEPTKQMPRNDVVSLVRHARRRNEIDEITGVLVYDHLTFFQILEGEDNVVDACFDRITADRRHHKIDVMIRQPIEERAFLSWRMGSLVYHADDG